MFAFLLNENRKDKVKKCSDTCDAICDFCFWHDFNGRRGVYTEKGYCNLHAREQDPGGRCDDFVCMNVEYKPGKPVGHLTRNGKPMKPGVLKA